MDVKTLGLRVAGTIFGLVAILHLLRLVTEIPVTIGEWLVPMWINMVGLIGAAGLCFFLLLVSARPEK